jgi:hypothetical protein
VPRVITAIAPFALALGHAGLWAQSGLAKPYCEKCRRFVVTATVLVIVAAAAFAAAGAFLWLRAASVAAKLKP